MYNIIQFDDNAISAVQKSWMISETQCHYPKATLYRNVIRNPTNPGIVAKWNIFDVDLIVTDLCKLLNFISFKHNF